MKTIDVSKIYLKTQRLVIRPWTNEDFEDFYAYAKDNVGMSAGWMKIKDRDCARIFLKHFIEDNDTLAISYHKKVIGNISIKLLKDNNQACKIGYVLGKAYWGEGIMHEALEALIDYIFNDLKLEYIKAEYLSTNLRSKRVLEKCGFKIIKEIDSKLKNYPHDKCLIVELCNKDKSN